MRFYHRSVLWSSAVQKRVPPLWQACSTISPCHRTKRYWTALQNSEYLQNRRRNHGREHYPCQTTLPWRCHSGRTQDLPPRAFWLASNGASWWWRVCRNLATRRSEYLFYYPWILHTNFLHLALRRGLVCVSLPWIDLPNISTILIALFLSVGYPKDSGHQNLTTTISLRPSRSVLDFTAALGSH